MIGAVQESDLAQIAEILNHEILTGFAHFGTEPLTLDQIGQEFTTRERHIWLAARDAEKVLGFARSNPWKSRGGYRQTCELGVYVRPEAHGRGIGTLLYEAILPELRARSFKTVLAGIALPNPASVRLHEKLGFKPVGCLPSVGYKLGEWRDVGYWALVFSEPPV